MKEALEKIKKQLIETLHISEEQALELAQILLQEATSIEEIKEEPQEYIIEPEQIGDFWRSKIKSKYPVEELRLEIQQIITDHTGKKYFKAIEGMQDILPASIDMAFLETFLPDGTYQILLRCPDGKLLGRQIIQISKTKINTEAKQTSTGGLEELLKTMLIKMEQRENLLLNLFKQRTEPQTLSIKEILSLIKETQPKVDLTTIYSEILRTIRELEKGEKELKMMSMQREEVKMYPNIEPPQPPPMEMNAYEILKNLIESELISKIVPEQYKDLVSKFINKDQIIAILKNTFEDNALFLLSQEELSFEIDKAYYNGYIQGFRDGQLGKVSLKQQQEQK